MTTAETLALLKAACEALDKVVAEFVEYTATLEAGAR
jgi:hypothetical protein